MIADPVIVDTRAQTACVREAAREILVSDAVSGVDRGGAVPGETEPRRYVLVVEDDEGICEVIAAILADVEIETVSARTAERATRLVRERRPSLILLDMSAAGEHLDGLLAEYRRSPYEAAPIVVVSGHPNGNDLATAIGANAFLEKPFDVLVLLDTVEEAFAR